MPPINLEIPHRIPSRKKGFTDLERGFVDEGEGIKGKIVLPFLSDFDHIGVTVRFTSDEFPDVFKSAPSYSEAHRMVAYDDLAVDAITSAIEEVLPKGMAN